MESNKISIVFTGDVGFDRYMSKKWEDENLLSPSVLDFLHSAEHVCANVEGALIDCVDDAKGAHMDLSVVVPLSRKSEEGKWKNSRFEKVKEYLLSML
jgi:hypothetical protein